MEHSKQQRIRELTDRLNRCRYEYYNLNAPSLTDAEYDALFDELSVLEKETGFNLTNSPTQTVGCYPAVSTLEKTTHKIPLLSLDKTKSSTELLRFAGEQMVMLMLKKDSIRDVILFPTMKPLDLPKTKKPEEVGIIGGATGAVEIEVKDEPIDFSKVEIEPLFKDFVDFETFSKSDFRAVKVKSCEAVKKSKKLLKFVLDDGTGTDRVILSGIHEYYEPEELVGKTCVAITNLPPRPMMGIASEGMLISAVHHENGEEKLHLLMLDPHIPAGAKMY